MIHPIPENWSASPAKPNWWKRCGIALLAGAFTGLLFWCFTGRFSSACIITTGLILSGMGLSRVEERLEYGNRAGNWLAVFCTHWRCTRRGILLYSQHEPGPCLFLPWESLHAAKPCENGISLEDAANDTFYELPLAASMQSDYLERIQKFIRLHHVATMQDDSICKPVYYLMSPHLLTIRLHFILALPWIVLGLLSPIFWPGEIVACALCFTLGASIGSSFLTDFEDDWGDGEFYIGEETSRSRRGVSLRMDGGIRSFIPWRCATEGTQLEGQNAFLQLRGGIFGILLSDKDNSIPVPLTRRFLKRHRLARKFCRLVIFILFVIFAVLWPCWWM